MCHLVSYWYHFWLSLVVGIVMLPDKFGRLSTKRKTYYCWRWHVDASWCLEVELRGVQVVIAILNFTSAYFSFLLLLWVVVVVACLTLAVDVSFGILVLLLGNASILWIPFWSNIAPKNQETSTCFFTRPGDDEGWTFGKKKRTSCAHRHHQRWYVTRSCHSGIGSKFRWWFPNRFSQYGLAANFLKAVLGWSFGLHFLTPSKNLSPRPHASKTSKGCSTKTGRVAFSRFLDLKDLKMRSGK